MARACDSYLDITPNRPLMPHHDHRSSHELESAQKSGNVGTALCVSLGATLAAFSSRNRALPPICS
jgi:hypothetical protein